MCESRAKTSSSIIVVTWFKFLHLFFIDVKKFLFVSTNNSTVGFLDIEVKSQECRFWCSLKYRICLWICHWISSSSLHPLPYIHHSISFDQGHGSCLCLVFSTELYVLFIFLTFVFFTLYTKSVSIFCGIKMEKYFFGLQTLLFTWKPLLQDQVGALLVESSWLVMVTNCA